jgi:hypothetical protein
VAARSGEASYHAIYLVLNDHELFPASLRSIYPHISGATVVTSYDRDRYGRPVTPDRTIAELLSRDLDPERKVNVLVATEGTEPALRNRAMAFAALPPAAGDRWAPAPGLARIERPDWFWIVDADEIYAEDDVARLKGYVRSHPAVAYRVAADNYWRTWNWRIEQRGTYLVLVRPGTWFGHLRERHVGLPGRAVQKLVHERVVPEGVGWRLQRTRVVPRSVAVFHHGSYLGDRGRIAAKLAASGHAPEFLDGWLDRVWDAWTPDARDLHPVAPPTFPQAHHVPTAALPPEIRDHPWPPGWLEPAPVGPTDRSTGG